MQRILVRTKRAVLVIAVWLVAVVAVCYCIGIWQERSQLAEEVDLLARQYDAQMDEYTQVLADKQRITDDPEFQLRFLKTEMGYAESNETPIVIRLDDQADLDDQTE